MMARDSSQRHRGVCFIYIYIYISTLQSRQLVSTWKRRSTDGSTDYCTSNAWHRHRATAEQGPCHGASTISWKLERLCNLKIGRRLPRLKSLFTSRYLADLSRTYGSVRRRNPELSDKFLIMCVMTWHTSASIRFKVNSGMGAIVYSGVYEAQWC